MKETEDNSDKWEILKSLSPSINVIEQDIMYKIKLISLPQEEIDDWFGFATYCYCKLKNYYAEFPKEELRKESDDFDFEISPLMEEVFNEAGAFSGKYDIDHLAIALEYVQKNYHLFYDDDDYDKDDDPENWDDPYGIHYELLDSAYESICSKVDTSTFKKLSMVKN